MYMLLSDIDPCSAMITVRLRMIRNVAPYAIGSHQTRHSGFTTCPLCAPVPHPSASQTVVALHARALFTGPIELYG